MTALANVSVEPRVVSTICPYCRDALTALAWIRCCGCGTGQHAICVAEHGRCAVHGCAGRRPLPKIVEQTQPPASLWRLALRALIWLLAPTPILLVLFGIALNFVTFVPRPGVYACAETLSTLSFIAAAIIAACTWRSNTDPTRNRVRRFP